MTRFVRHHSGAVVCTFNVFEADLVRSLASQMVELLRNEQAAPATFDDPLEAMFDFSGPVDEPDDPVLLRLFPTAYPDDPEAAGEFRRFTESTLRDSKERDAGDDEVWESLPDEDPRTQAYDVYQWLGWLQETLVDAISE